MRRVITAVGRFLKESKGANGIEYAFLAGILAVAYVVGSGLLGTAINAALGDTTTCVSAPNANNCATPVNGDGKGKGRGKGNGKGKGNS